jgi:hypothetical protein
MKGRREMRHTVTVEEIEAMGMIEHQLAAVFGKSYSKRLKLRYDFGRARAYWIVVLNNDDDHALEHDTLEQAVEAYNEA